MKKRLTALLPLALLLGSVSVQAEPYTIEMAVFRQPTHAPGTLPATSGPDLSNTVSLTPYNGTPLHSLERLPSSSYILNGDINRLNRQGYEVLYHAAWMQDLSDRNVPRIHIHSNDGRVDGVVSVELSRYLHFKPDLLLSDTQPVVPLAPTATTPMTDSAASDAFTTEPVTPQEYRLKQSRRMRSDEIHYLDNPNFGILVVINPVKTP